MGVRVILLLGLEIDPSGCTDDAVPPTGVRGDQGEAPTAAATVVADGKAAAGDSAQERRVD
jgi:hypothetical protein